MSDTDVEGPETGGENTSAPALSLRERLAARRQAIGDPDRHHDLDVPGYDGNLFIRHVPLPGGWDEVKKLNERIRKSKNPRKELQAAADIIVRTTAGIYVRQENGDVEPLDDATADEPPTFAEPERIGPVLGFSVTPNNKKMTARQTVFAVFNNDLAVNGHYFRLSEWLEEATGDDDEEYLGESSGSTK